MTGRPADDPARDPGGHHPPEVDAILSSAAKGSIAIPAVVIGGPADEATRIAVATMREDGVRHGGVAVTPACFDQHTLALYEKELGA